VDADYTVCVPEDKTMLWQLQTLQYIQKLQWKTHQSINKRLKTLKLYCSNRVCADLSIWGDRSIALADWSPNGVRRDRFIDRLAVLMRSNFQFHVISRIDIGLFC